MSRLLLPRPKTKTGAVHVHGVTFKPGPPAVSPAEWRRRSKERNKVRKLQRALIAKGKK